MLKQVGFFIIFMALAIKASGKSTTKIDVVDNPWRFVSSPALGEAVVYGSVNHGCIQGARALLPDDNGGYAVMTPYRNRFYGHPNLIKTIEDLGSFAKTLKLGDVLIGDMSQPRGGPMAPSRHASHETGLDVDVRFDFSEYVIHRLLHDKERVRLTENEKQELQKERVLNERLRNSVAANSALTSVGKIHPLYWDPFYNVRKKNKTKLSTKPIREVLKFLAIREDIDLIYVQPVIKLILCRSGDEADRRTWLKKIKPAYGHYDHFHLRLKCPANSPQCVPDEISYEPNQVDSCDENFLRGLINWKGRQAYNDYLDEQRKKRAVIEWPSECKTTLLQ